MALELFFPNSCETNAEDFAHRIRSFTALMPAQTPGNFETVNHSKEQGLINFDFTIEAIQKLLTSETKGLRIIPALKENGKLTVVITAYKEDLSEVYIDDKLLADCCPQPPPPYNKTSRLYYDLYP